METMIQAQRVVQSGHEGMAGRRFSKAKALSGRLGVCPRTLFRWADAGLITRHKINARVVLFDESEVAAMLESSRVG
ncbi:MAG TPA: helix-turn-helix domain-containing protein [Opitutaceae bacterium]|nr:helix-turn-helix domain-containing protein [Opitutaceae bacterium]